MHTKDATPAHRLRIKQNIIWGLCLLLWAPSMAEARDNQEPSAPGAILKVTSEVVNVYAVVRKHGRLISNLDKDDFRLEEDNKPQVIRYFAREADAPLAMGILVDTSPSQDRVLEVERTEAKAFLQEVMRPTDRTFVLRFDVEAELLQDLTADHPQLDKAIEACAVNSGGVTTLPGTVPSGGAGGATHLFDGVYLSARELLKNEVGRKVLILLTDGEDQGGEVKLDAAIEAAQKSDTIIYSITISDPSFYSGLGMGFRGNSILRKLSEDTGGRVIQAKNMAATSLAFHQIADELRTQYFLGYTPSNTLLDGTFRQIEVKVHAGGVKVNHRRGYYAPEG